MALQVGPVLVEGHLARPAALGQPGVERIWSIDDVQGGVVALAVLRPKRLRHELRRLEPERYVEIRRNELGHTAIVERCRL